MFPVMSVYHSVHRGSHVTIIYDALDLTVQGLLAIAPDPRASDTGTPDPQPWPWAPKHRTWEPLAPLALAYLDIRRAPPYL